MRFCFLLILMFYSPLLFSNSPNEKGVEPSKSYAGTDITTGSGIFKECFYVGSDAGAQKIVCGSNREEVKEIKKTINKDKKTTPLLNIYGGYRINELCALEAGTHISHYFFMPSRKSVGKSRLSNIHGSIVLIAPVNDKIEVLPAIGFSRTKVKISINGMRDNFTNVAVIPRFMVATQYRLSEKVRLRLSGIYYFTSGFANNMITVNDYFSLAIGLNFDI
ncbi:MAG TPA: hypothetical protein VGK47_09605 [Nitrososphaeraceae archaeon]